MRCMTSCCCSLASRPAMTSQRNSGGRRCSGCPTAIWGPCSAIAVALKQSLVCFYEVGDLVSEGGRSVCWISP